MRRILLALGDQTQADFSDAPLEKVASYLSDLHGIPIRLNLPELEKIGISAETKVSLIVNRISLLMALQRCVPTQAAFVVTDEGILITARASKRPLQYYGMGPATPSP